MKWRWPVYLLFGAAGGLLGGLASCGDPTPRTPPEEEFAPGVARAQAAEQADGGAEQQVDGPTPVHGCDLPYFAGTSRTSLTGVPSRGSSFLSVSSLTYFSSFIVRLVWKTVWSVTGKMASSVPVRSAP